MLINLRKELCETFGYENYRELRLNLQDADEDFPFKTDWRCLAKGRMKHGRLCAFGERIGRMTSVDKCFVSEYNTYIRFKADPPNPTIYRYINPLEMRGHIRAFDETGMFEDLEDGEVFVLEAVTKARSREYAATRRDSIKLGFHTVKPRGPNVNKRRTKVHHFRPY